MIGALILLISFPDDPEIVRQILDNKNCPPINAKNEWGKYFIYISLPKQTGSQSMHCTKLKVSRALDKE